MFKQIISLWCLMASPVSAQFTGQTWDWQLSAFAAPAGQIDILDLDPDGVTAADIAALKARGIYAICYVSVGTIEDWRSDAAVFPTSVVGKAYDDWAGERFLDIRQMDILLPLMRARFDDCRAKGFDAIEPDNMDVKDNDSGFAVTDADTVAYVRALADLAHEMGVGIGQKNLSDLTQMLEPHLDFIITEGCYADGWCDDVLAYAASGKAILATEYDISPDQRPAACTWATTNGVSMIFKTYDLDATGSSCP